MLSRSELARKIARYIAFKRFRGHWDRASLLSDAESVAFELEAMAPPHVTAGCIGFMAVKRVGVGRQFNESVRSITTSKYDKRSKRPKNLRQIHVHLCDVAAVDAAPSESVPGWLDYQEWLKQYGRSRKRKIAEALAIGTKTQEVARQYGVSDGRISQMRREFQADWNKFQHVN